MCLDLFCDKQILIVQPFFTLSVAPSNDLWDSHDHFVVSNATQTKDVKEY